MIKQNLIIQNNNYFVFGMEKSNVGVQYYTSD
jgi:hypothetical protein